MKKPLSKLFIGVLSLFIIASCGSSEETIVIEDAPTSSNRTDTTQQDTEPMGPFKQLTIGENQSIHTLDPLFIQNDAGRRTLQLMYEGLVRFDENGDIKSAIANDWSVNNNGRTYRFTLNNELFYHDSNIFSNGRGRRLVAADVKKVFERMAKATVPDHAAQLFMDISGFEPYYREQHQVMMASERQLNGVSGISTPNDSTVVFRLVEADKQFLNKLASPYAVIYPQESVRGDSFRPVGTGPFSFSQTRSDSLYIFSRFDNYRISGQPKVNRIDVVTSTSETALLNALNRDEIQLIPELGPNQLRMAMNSNGSLASTFQSNYSLYQQRQPSEFNLMYNTGADLSRAAAAAALARAESGDYFSDIPGNGLSISWNVSDAGSSASSDTLLTTYTDNPFVRAFYEQISRNLQSQGVTFEMSQTGVRNRDTALYLSGDLMLGEPMMAASTEEAPLVAISAQPTAIAHNDIENLNFNYLPWWLDLRDVTLPSQSNR